jgi:hypothetical protein
MPRFSTVVRRVAVTVGLVLAVYYVVATLFILAMGMEVHWFWSKRETPPEQHGDIVTIDFIIEEVRLARIAFQKEPTPENSAKLTELEGKYKYALTHKWATRSVKK